MASKRTAAKRLKLGDSCRFRVGVLGGFLAYPYVASWHLSTKLRGLPGQSEWRLSGEDETEWADLLFGGYRRRAAILSMLKPKTACYSLSPVVCVGTRVEEAGSLMLASGGLLPREMSSIMGSASPAVWMAR